MASFVKPSGLTEPFGRNEFLRSTNPKPRTESFTLSAAAWPEVIIDGNTEKIAQPGTVLAKITSGPEAGKLGPFGLAEEADFPGLGDTGGIPGLLLTFLPWQLLERDVEVSVVYDASVVQAWCLERSADGDFAPLSNGTAEALRSAKKLSILFS